MSASLNHSRNSSFQKQWLIMETRQFRRSSQTAMEMHCKLIKHMQIKEKLQIGTGIIAYGININ